MLGKWIAGMASALLGLTACSTPNSTAVIEQTLASGFANEVQLVSTRKLLPSEPFARWQGRYGVYVRDRVTGDDFMVRWEKSEDAQALLGKLHAARAEQQAFGANQRAALAALKNAGLQSDFFSLKAVSPLYGNMRWTIAYFADTSALQRNHEMWDAATWKALALIARMTPQPSISIYPHTLKTAYASPLSKGYHGMIEFIEGEPQTFMQSQDSGGESLWTLDDQAIAAQNIVSAQQAALRKACYAAIEAMRTDNYFFKHHGLYMQPTRLAYEAYKISAQLKARGLRQGHTSFALLDRIDGRMVLRGIVAPDALDSAEPYAVLGVYAYDYFLASGDLIVRNLESGQRRVGN